VTAPATSDATTLTTVAVLGAGTMGAGIAQVCAQAGLATRLHDVSDELAAAGRSRVDAMLRKGVEKGKVSVEERDATLGLLSITSDLPAAVRGAEVVIEAAPERLELKRSIFAQVAAVVSPACLLATNTSSLSITAIAEGLPAPERFVGMHFFNPVPVMALLEVVSGEGTDEATVALAVSLGRRLGKEPIVVLDRPGFASSRLGLALGLEAIRMVEEGVASAADIDKAMELGYRHPMGPLKLTDLVGLDVRLAIADYLAEKLDDRRFAAPPLLRRLVAEGHVGQKSGRGLYRWVDGKPEEP
jgi:3-hydroxybutyryl-CoA dehydrogenase